MKTTTNTSASNKISNVSFKFLFLIIGSYVVILAALMLSSKIQRSMIFLDFVGHPWFANFSSPQDFGLINTENIIINGSNGNKIGLWKVKSKSNKKCLFVHGNACNRAQHVNFYKLLRNHCEIYAVDYSGFGGNNALPSEDNVLNDLTAVIDHFNGEIDYFIGHSLGTALVSRFSMEQCKIGKCPKGIALISAIYSIYDVMFNYPGFSIVLFPLRIFSEEFVQSFIYDRFTTLEYLKNTSAKVLLIHGTSDFEVNVGNSRKLHIGLMKENYKQVDLVEVSKAGHNNILTFEQTLEAISHVVKA